MSVDALMKRLKGLRRVINRAHDTAETVGHYDSVKMLAWAENELNDILFELVSKGIVLALLPVDEDMFDMEELE